MLDQPIEVLDSYLRFTDLVQAARALESVGTATVPPAIAQRGELEANLWRCGWDLRSSATDDGLYGLEYTRSPLASWVPTYEALLAVAPFVLTGSFVLLNGDHRGVQQVRFLNQKACFERGRLAFVPHRVDAGRRGQVVVGIDDDDLAPIHAHRLARELVSLLGAMRIRQFEVRAELLTRTGRHVDSSGPQPGDAL